MALTTKVLAIPPVSEAGCPQGGAGSLSASSKAQRTYQWPDGFSHGLHCTCPWALVCPQHMIWVGTAAGDSCDHLGVGASHSFRPPPRHPCLHPPHHWMTSPLSAAALVCSCSLLLPLEPDGHCEGALQAWPVPRMLCQRPGADRAGPVHMCIPLVLRQKLHLHHCLHGRFFKPSR